MREVVLWLLLAAAAVADPSPAPSPRALLPDRFSANDFAALTAARAARMNQLFPRIAAFLVSRRAEIEVAQAKAARRSMPAARSPALAALEAWLSQPPPEEALTQCAAYLTAPPLELLRDGALLLAAREEAKLQEAAAEIAKEAESTHAELAQAANDPRLTPQEREQLKSQLAELAKTETALTTTGQPVPSEAIALATKYRDAIDSWTKWSWPKP